jgi:tetratricopeptide (TPR) repeat protein
MLQIVLKGDAPPADRAMALYLDGRRALKQGEYNRAIELWNMAAAMDDRPSRARALFARTMAEFDAKQMSRADAIKALDGLRFAWRGDSFEFDLLQKLGDLKIADGDLRGGFDVLREAAGAFPDNPASKEVMKRLSDGFADIFLGPRMNEVSPLKALSLYEEFKDFAPVGERGDAVVRRLVDRLVSVDLLDNAATLLDDQVNHRLTGRDKARVAAQLALLRLLDHKPEAAIQALDIDVGKDVPAELGRQRQQLRARALSELHRDQEALALLANDTSRDADRLRADIFWRAHDWSEAAKIFARLVPAPQGEGKLDKETSQLVLNWASALTLAGDQRGLAELRAAYGKGMAETPFADAFRIVAGDPTQLATGDDPRTVANRVAQVSELQSFMANFKERLAKDKLSNVN